MDLQKVKNSTCLRIMFVMLLICIAGMLYWKHLYTGTLHISYDTPSYGSLEDLTANADCIVIGTYTAFEGTWNMSRDPADISREATDSYVEGRLYRFQVSSVLKGEVSEDQITVNLWGGEQVTWGDDSFLVTDPSYVEPALDQTYLLFLTSEQSPAFDGYYGTGSTFAVRLEDSGIAQLEISRYPDSETVITPSGKRLVIEVDTAAPAEDHISEMPVEEVLETIQNLLE